MHVWRTKIEISPPGEQENSNALHQDQQDNQIMACPPPPSPADFTLIGALVPFFVNLELPQKLFVCLDVLGELWLSQKF